MCTCTHTMTIIALHGQLVMQYRLDHLACTATYMHIHTWMYMSKARENNDNINFNINIKGHTMSYQDVGGVLIATRALKVHVYMYKNLENNLR